MLRGGETRCSAVWSAHLFWVQRAIGSNPVTLMWRKSRLLLAKSNFIMIVSQLLLLIVRTLGAVLALSLGVEKDLTVSNLVHAF